MGFNLNWHEISFQRRSLDSRVTGKVYRGVSGSIFLTFYLYSFLLAYIEKNLMHIPKESLVQELCGMRMNKRPGRLGNNVLLTVNLKGSFRSCYYYFCSATESRFWIQFWNVYLNIFSKLLFVCFKNNQFSFIS